MISFETGNMYLGWVVGAAQGFDFSPNPCLVNRHLLYLPPPSPLPLSSTFRSISLFSGLLVILTGHSVVGGKGIVQVLRRGPRTLHARRQITIYRLPPS